MNHRTPHLPTVCPFLHPSCHICWGPRHQAPAISLWVGGHGCWSLCGDRIFAPPVPVNTLAKYFFYYFIHNRNLRGNCLQLCVEVQPWLAVEVMAANNRVLVSGDYGFVRIEKLGVMEHLNLQLNIGRGTGMGTLIPTCPASISRWKRAAVAPLLVKMATPLPYSFSLIRSMASSRVSASRHTRTGPKISSL